MGKGSKPTIGYWYKPAFHVGLGIGPIDSYREFRGGDKPAWRGNLTASGTITINAPNLWGGEKDQGGIVSDVDVMFGEEDQQPNPYLITTFGDQQSAWRGLATLVFKGGKYGAMNPYPHPASHKIVKILKGWDGDVCWYPEKAAIGFAGVNGGYRIEAMSSIGMTTPDGDAWTDVVTAPTAGPYIVALPDRYLCWGLSGAAVYTHDGETWIEGAALPAGGSANQGCVFDECVMVPQGLSGYSLTADGGESFETFSYPEFPRSSWMVASPNTVMMTTHYSSKLWTANNPRGPWVEGAEAHLLYAGHGIVGAYGDGTWMWGSSNTPVTDEFPLMISAIGVNSFSEQTLPGEIHVDGYYINGLAYGNNYFLATTSDNQLIRKANGGSPWELLGESPVGTPVWNGLQFILGKFYWKFSTFTLSSENGDVWVIDSIGGAPGHIATGYTIDTRTYASSGINPAHALYYARTHIEIGREPIANINDASYRAAADKLHAEAFAICTEYDPSAESLIEFEQRICNLIGGGVNRSLVDGQWYLDLARGDYVLEELPILTDDDILSFSEQPSILDNAINSVSVKYFDPERKESIVTPPVQALALIDSFGTIHQAKDYPEIPHAALAAQIAERDLRAAVTPTRAFDLVTKRTPYDWRPNTYFRLQAPKRGIADMVCLLGSKETGTLKSGAVKIAAMQDIYSLPDTSYIEIEHGVDTRPPQTPVRISLQRVFEAPYIELAGMLTQADLNVLAEDSGYLLSVAAEPALSRDYTLMVRPSGGEYGEAGAGDWCPTAVVVEGAGYDDTTFTLADGLRLDEVTVGSAVLWEAEICRVDALDVIAGSITLARGCADTVSSEHGVGTRLWFYQDAAAADTTQYTDGEVVSVKLLTNTGSQQLVLALATPMSLAFNQRQSRPYPPALFRIDGEVAPTSVVETGVVTWVHRDRLLQADQLIDSEMASIGPEITTRYALRLFDGTDTLIIERLDIAGATASFVLDYTGNVTLELYSISDNGQSLQSHVRTFAYTPPGGTVTNQILAPTYTPGDEIIDGGEVAP